MIDYDMKPIDVKKGQKVICAVMFRFEKVSDKPLSKQLDVIIHPHLSITKELFDGDADEFYEGEDPSPNPTNEGVYDSCSIMLGAGISGRMYTDAIYFDDNATHIFGLDNDHIRDIVKILSKPEIKKLFVPYRKLQKIPRDAKGVYIL
jgi:hypothetical protein